MTRNEHVIARAGLDALFAALIARGYTVVAPVMRDGAIVYDEARSSADLPAGWTDEQDAGRYRLRRRADSALFGYAVGPQSWKRFQLPPELRLWRARVDGHGGLADIETAPATHERYAFVGVRPCELRAIGILDRVLEAGHGERLDVLVVAVNCGEAGGTCFCDSMGTGPTALEGYDLALTEILDEAGHRFLVDVGSERGAEVLGDVPHTGSRTAEHRAAEAAHARAVAQMGRRLDTTDLRDVLLANLDHPRWDEVAERCLSCGNCTMVCPTCFCTSVEDVTDLPGTHVERHQRWDSCFTLDHSAIHGGAVRGSVRSRYRQWMTHKLATWIDQFGTSGCVGCGRCITWCPVGIDITEEARAIRGDEGRAA